MFTVAEMHAKIGEHVADLGIPVHDQDVPDEWSATEAKWVCENGVVYANNVTGVHAMWDRVAEAYEGSGEGQGALGFPTTDEHDVIQVHGYPSPSLVVGASCEFQGGRIMQAAGVNAAFVIFGLIWSTYQAADLGFPDADQKPLSNGWYVQTFRSSNGSGRDGAIYAHETEGTFILYDSRFAEHYLGAGGPNGWLGRPVAGPATDHIATSSSAFDADTYAFEFGRLAIRSDGQVDEFPETREFHRHYQPGAPVDIEGWLTLSARGDAWFRGHAHDSGYPSYFFSFVVAVKNGRSDGASIAFAKHGHLGGTLDPDDRSEDWNQHKVDLTVRDNWWRIRTASVETAAGYQPDAALLPLQVLLTIIVAPFWLVAGFNEAASKSSYGGGPGGGGGCQPSATTVTSSSGETFTSLAGCPGVPNSDGSLAN